MNQKCKECNKSYTKLINESIKNFPTLYKLCNGDLNKLFLLLRKGVYPYEYINSWKKINENALPPKEAFYSELNWEGIFDADYEDVKNVWEAFAIKHLVECHDLYLQCNTLLLADLAHFLSAPGLLWQEACLKKKKVELELLANIDMLLMFEKEIRGGICQEIHMYAKENDIWRIIIKIPYHHI